MKPVKFLVSKFKLAVASGDPERKREAEQELREALASYDLESDSINYLIASFKRAVEIEQAYEKKCEEVREIRELIAKAYRILY